MYGTAFLGFNLVQWWYKQPFVDVPRKAFDRIVPRPINVIILMLGFLAVVGYAISRGVQLGFRIDRNMNLYLGTQLWVVMIFVVNGLTMFMFAGWSRLSHLEKIAVVTSIILFILFQLTMGNRRDFLAMFIFLIGVVEVSLSQRSWPSESFGRSFRTRRFFRDIILSSSFLLRTSL